LLIKRVVAIDCIGQGPNPLPFFQKLMSDPSASVAKCACHYMQASVHVIAS
jgi:hypothetical protein